MDRVWPAKATNDEVVLSEVEPLLVRAQAGFAVSLLCFGQTGTLRQSSAIRLHYLHITHQT